ncbi:MAG: diphthine synthase [Thermoprotei archaeon]|nr:MAG: diphthine synthase [Thermoprotei archaeon]
MGCIAFIGLGLYGLRDISIGAIEYLRRASRVFMEKYTSILPDFKKEELEVIIGKKIEVLTRGNLEEESGEIIIESAKEGNVAFVSIGDPLIATTHISLMLSAIRENIKVLVFPSPSIINGVIASTGLHIYKFSRPVTLTFIEEKYKYYPFTAYSVLEDNLKRGLHTLFLLDIRISENRIMNIKEAVNVLIELERIEKRQIIDEELTIGIGIARSTAPDECVYVDILRKLKEFDFGPPPYTLVIPGLLHQTEIEALNILGKADKEKLLRWNQRIKSSFLGRI